jgi:hypothetical protein
LLHLTVYMIFKWPIHHLLWEMKRQKQYDLLVDRYIYILQKGILKMLQGSQFWSFWTTFSRFCSLMSLKSWTSERNRSRKNLSCSARSPAAMSIRYRNMIECSANETASYIYKTTIGLIDRTFHQRCTQWCFSNRESPGHAN